MAIRAFVAAVAIAVAGGPRLSAEETALLFELGVSREEIAATAERHGGFAPLDDKGAALLRAAGADDDFVDFVAGVHPTLTRLKDLAERFEPEHDAESGLAFLRPKGWRSARSAVPGGGTVIRMSASDGEGWFAQPTIFIFVQSGGAPAAEAEEAAGERIRDMLIGRLERLRLHPEPPTSDTLTLLGAPAALHRIRAGARSGDVVGEIAVAVRLTGDGRAVGAGWSAPVSACGATSDLFRDAASALSLRRR